MLGKKKWYLSKGIWAGVFGFSVSLLKLVDSHFGTNILNTEIIVAITGLLGLFGAHGRKTAKSEIE